MRERVSGEEAEERAALSRRLVAAGLVGCLHEDGHCHELHAALTAAHGSMRGFASCWLRDVSQDAGGTCNLLQGQFAPVALCCGGDRVGGQPWSAQNRVEAISYVCNRMVDARVWPERMRGKKMSAQVYS